MPYIKNEERALSALAGKLTIGQVNYLITNELQTYIQDHGLSYVVLNELIGVLECAKLELYRRIAAPYEDKKIKENGDVYTVQG